MVWNCTRKKNNIHWNGNCSHVWPFKMQFWTNVVARNLRERIALPTTTKCAVNCACNPMFIQMDSLANPIAKKQPIFIWIIILLKYLSFKRFFHFFPSTIAQCNFYIALWNYNNAYSLSLIGAKHSSIARKFAQCLLIKATHLSLLNKNYCKNY